ncbi:hypothetical protein PR048_018674 [Dryococelus australis]|uniref:Uncharacterized protein n=1 Tax=Dryococelus australis TaxID=614101 RepID=A0ABQ9HDC7_9NEOP|nr:hypothetical protein PR048_018674 [Dryococelus australis]
MVYLIGMQSEPDGDYKFILKYQDHLTKFVVFQPLKTKTAVEVADIILDIFCLLGTPNILHSENGREFCNKISSPMETEGSIRVCIVCDQQFEEEISSFECAEYFHSTCTSAPQSEIPLCHFCVKKSAIETSRKPCERGLEEESEKML